MSELHRQEIRDLMAYLRGQVRKATEEELEASLHDPKFRLRQHHTLGTRGILMRRIRPELTLQIR
jgi:hypothetical protein